MQIVCHVDVEEQVSLEEEEVDNEEGTEEKIPVIGARYESFDTLHQMYKDYAFNSGFQCKIRTTKFDAMGVPCYRMLTCAREGKPRSKLPPEVKTNPSIATNCKARISASLEADTWVINNVVLEHSHDLIPSQARHFPSNRHIPMFAKRRLEIDDSAGVRLYKTYSSIIHQVGGPDKVPFSERDARNYARKEIRRVGLLGDAQAMMQYFARMQGQNGNFYYEIRHTEDMRITHAFWCDARSRASYDSFGDVISFDTTCLTNMCVFVS